MPYDTICCTYHQQKYSSPNRSTNKKTRDTKKNLPFGKWRFRERAVGAWANSRKSSRTRQKNKEIYKTEIKLTATEILDKGETSESPASIRPWTHRYGDTSVRDTSVRGHIGTGHIGTGHIGTGHIGTGHIGTGTQVRGHIGTGTHRYVYT